jgi:hypothetical protein
LNSARLPLSPVALTVTVPQLLGLGKLMVKLPLESACVPLACVSGPLATRCTFSPGWNPEPATLSGLWLTGFSSGRCGEVVDPDGAADCPPHAAKASAAIASKPVRHSAVIRGLPA